MLAGPADELAIQALQRSAGENGLGRPCKVRLILHVIAKPAALSIAVVHHGVLNGGLTIEGDGQILHEGSGGHMVGVAIVQRIVQQLQTLKELGIGRGHVLGIHSTASL